jgi:glycosyltransferase involved in cell wall biosynthesis
VPDDLVVTHPLPEYARMLAMKLGLGPVMVDRVWEVTERSFAGHVARHHLDGAQAVYGYSHAALEPFRVQASRGGQRIYEVPHAHHATVTALLQPELERFPALRTPYMTHTGRLDGRRNRRRDEELALADLVIVNSSFARDSFLRAGTDPERVRVVPLGAPPVLPSTPRREREPFIFLSAGSQSVAKGTHYLLDAWRRLAPGPAAELWLVGTMQLPAEALRGLPGTVVQRPTIARDELFALYQRAGALVFPSLFEGFGMVITEAMAHGLPVITTPNTAGRDLIESGRNGLLVPAGDAATLATAMEWCLQHPAEALEMGHEAARSVSSWQWAEYRSALAAVVGDLLSERIA